jgi:hypothetical protein
MKYTKYILSDKFVDINALKTEKILFKVPMILISIPVAFVGIATIIGFLPMTITVDGVRRTMYVLIRFRRRGYRILFLENFSFNRKLVRIFEKNYYEKL